MVIGEEEKTHRSPAEQDNPQEETSTTSGRAPPLVLNSSVNLFNIQEDVNEIGNGNFEFRSTHNGTRRTTQAMADYSAVRAHLEAKILNLFILFPKSEKPIQAVIRHLPIDTPAEVISSGLEELVFNAVSVKQMTATRASRE
jgi:hypothetical protein